MKQENFPPFFWLVLPLFGVIASYSGNRQLLLEVFLIAALTAFSIIGVPEKPTGKRYDQHVMMLILSISLTLLMSQSVSSSYLQGGDIHQEYNDFSRVLATGFLNLGIGQGAAHTYNSVLSVTVFPAVLKIVSGLDGTVIFTIVFPLLFSITPVLLYKLCRMFLGPTESFFAAFLFLAYHDFYVVLIAEARQEIAEILLLVLLLLISSKLVKGSARSVSIILLTVGLVAAHYAIAYVYLFLLVFWYLMGLAFPKTRVVTSEEMGLTVSLTLVWFAILFAGTGTGGITVLVQFILSFNSTGFFSLASRPSEVSQALGIGVLSSPLHLLNRMTYYLVNGALGLGFLVALFKREKNDAESKILPVLAFGVLLIGAYVIVPNFGFGLGVAREYHIGLLLASPCFVYAVIFVTSIIRRLFHRLTHLPLRVPTRPIMNWRLVAATLLFLFLLFDSGWVWAVSLDRPSSPLLDSERILHSPDVTQVAGYYGPYLSSEDVEGARWLRQLGFVSYLCTDFRTRNNVLTSYGGFSRGNLSIITSFLPDASRCEYPGGGYVFLSVLNTVYGIGVSPNAGISGRSLAGATWRISQISSMLTSDNVIYSNGGTTIYTYPG